MPLPVLGVVHVNVNCSDLSRSLVFYRDRVGLAPLMHTNPLPQDGTGFGLPGRVQWDAYLLHDDCGPAGPAVDLLEWKAPAPIGEPHAAPNALGVFRLCLSVPDLDATYARLVAAGVPPPEVPVAGLWAVFFRDPDGTCLELIQRPELLPR